MSTGLDVTNFAPLNLLLVGVGGQGTILASDVLAETGALLGYDVKKAEIHGMSQRGGSVVSNLRWAREVFSPIVSQGSADVLVAFEKMEGLRFLDYLRPDGLALINDFSLEPMTVSSGGSAYPSDESLRDGIAQRTGRQFWIPGNQIAEKTGNARTANVVLLGALASLLCMDEVVMKRAFASRIPPRLLDINLLAFEAGKSYFQAC